LKKLIIKGMDNRYFSEKIVEWYLENKRELPWRNTKDPYKIWLSEIILQQTRVAQGLPYYNRFVAKYPDVNSLAKAPEQEVLRLWQGLGYYTRARNLHKCAKTVAERPNHQFPANYHQLKLLPGIGEYTAAAIASIAFKEPVAVVDGNVFRVISRIFGVETPINSPEGKKQFSELANSLVSGIHPDTHNQAMMEFGATFCTPKKPSCESCIFKKSCFALKNSLQQSLPVKLKVIKSKKRYFHYVVLKKGKRLLMKKRTGNDIWLGLYDFPLIEEKRTTHITKVKGGEGWLLKSLKTNAYTISDTYKHILTHQTIFCRFVMIDLKKSLPGADKTLKFYSFAEISDLPKPKLITRFLEDHTFYS
jgi:A/G-specific adenine glycosylase